MRIYLTERQVPELSPLAPTLQRLVYHRAMTLLRSDSKMITWLPTMLCVAGGLSGSLLGAYLFSYFGTGQSPITAEKITESIVWSYSGVAIGSFIAGFFGLQFQRCRLRPYLRQAIGE